MKKYTIKYILSMIVVATLAFAFVVVWLVLEEMNKPWVGIGIFVSCLAGFTHFIADCIYSKVRDTDNKLNISNGTLGIVFIFSIVVQLISTFIIIIEACKKFGDIHPIEYIIVSIFMYLSVYAFRKASYNLISKENKNEEE
jgi:hypothetical protein